MLKNLILKNRSYSRYDEKVAIDRETLKELIDLARLSASGANFQPLKYFLSCTPEFNDKVFSTLSWARALKSWQGPQKGGRPSAYIIILGDKRIVKSFGFDPGIAAQNILLGAVEKGLGGCMLSSCDRSTLMKHLNLDDELEIQLVVALGKPAEKVVIEPLGDSSNTDYYRDDQQVHHVPKRSLEEIIIGY